MNGHLGDFDVRFNFHIEMHEKFDIEIFIVLDLAAFWTDCCWSIFCYCVQSDKLFPMTAKISLEYHIT